VIKRSFRFNEELMKAAKETAKRRGYKSTNAFVAEATHNEIERGNSAIEESKNGVAATIVSLSREMRKQNNALQVLIAFQDALVKYLLTCIPEPPDGEILEVSRARARLRHEKFLRSVAQNITGGNLKIVFAELMADVEKT
jgi:hypothetical protein